MDCSRDFETVIFLISCSKARVIPTQLGDWVWVFYGRDRRSRDFSWKIPDAARVVVNRKERQ
jgi:hypothetical protein